MTALGINDFMKKNLISLSTICLLACSCAFAGVPYVTTTTYSNGFTALSNMIVAIPIGYTNGNLAGGTLTNGGTIVTTNLVALESIAGNGANITNILGYNIDVFGMDIVPKAQALEVTGGASRTFALNGSGGDHWLSGLPISAPGFTNTAVGASKLVGTETNQAQKGLDVGYGLLLTNSTLQVDSNTIAATSSQPTQTNISYTAVTNAPWGLPQTNISYTEITNALWGLPQTNISYVDVTNAPWANTNSVVWTNNGTYIWLVGKTAPTTTTPGPSEFFTRNGSLFFGTNAWQDFVINDFTKWQLGIISMTDSNEPSEVNFVFTATDNENYGHYSQFRSRMVDNKDTPTALISLEATATNAAGGDVKISIDNTGAKLTMKSTNVTTFLADVNGDLTIKGSFTGNLAGGTNLPISSLTGGQVLTNNNAGAVTFSNDFRLAGASSDLTVDGIVTNSAGFYVGTNVAVVPNSATPSFTVNAGSANSMTVSNSATLIGYSAPPVAAATYKLQVNGAIYSSAQANFVSGYYINGNQSLSISGSTLNIGDGSGLIGVGIYKPVTIRTNDLIVGGSITVSNGYVLPQLTAIPTNSIPVSSSGNTNWVHFNFTNTINGGGIQYIATNFVSGGFLLAKPTLTISTFP